MEDCRPSITKIPLTSSKLGLYGGGGGLEHLQFPAGLQLCGTARAAVGAGWAHCHPLLSWSRTLGFLSTAEFIES